MNDKVLITLLPYRVPTRSTPQPCRRSRQGDVRSCLPFGETNIGCRSAAVVTGSRSASVTGEVTP
jgi:hypothetical protein